MNKNFLFSILVFFSLFSLAKADPSRGGFFSQLAPDTMLVISLTNQDTLAAKFSSYDSEKGEIVVFHDTLGNLRIETAKIADVKVFNPETQVVTKGEVKEKNPKPKVWENQIAGGLNGTSGNSKNLSIRAGAKTKRQTEKNKSTLEGNYALGYSKDSTTNQNKKNTHRFTADARSEWPFPAVPRLNVFLSSSFEWDEFKDYDARWAIHSGLGYDVIKKDNFLFATHAGAGVSREFGGTNDRWTPEALAGLNLEYAPYELAKLTAGSEIFPDLRDMGEFRTVSKAAWTLFFSKAKTFNTSLGVEHRYDSTPGPNRKATDWDYFIALTWLF